jgi:hypothetical protein
MKRDTLITIIIIIAGFIIFTIGIVLGDLIWNVIGVMIIVLPPIILNIKKKKDRKSLIHYMEEEDESILSSKKTRVRFEIKEKLKKLRSFFEKAIIMIFIAGIALGLASILMTRYVFKPTHLTSETAIIEACSIYNRGGCKKDPSEIIINYDVNGDGIIGGVNDSLSNLLELYNCTDNCIKRRCGCVGY